MYQAEACWTGEGAARKAVGLTGTLGVGV